MGRQGAKRLRAENDSSAKDDLDEVGAAASNHDEGRARNGRPIDLDSYRDRKPREPSVPPPNMATKMSDTPSRDEVAARLEAAEARTETRFVQLNAAIESRAVATDLKLDALAGKLEAFSNTVTAALAEAKTDNKETRTTIWEVGIGAVLAVLALVVALWIAGINVQGNMIAMFESGLGIHEMRQGAALKSPPVSPLPAPSPPTPAQKK